MQSSEQGTCTQKRLGQDIETSNHRTGGIRRHTHSQKKNVWKSVDVPRECSVCRPSEAGTRISLQENLYVETYKCPVALKVI